MHACAATDNAVAPYAGPGPDHPRSVQILGLIQSAAFRLSRSADVFVVSQFCMRLAAPRPRRRRRGSQRGRSNFGASCAHRRNNVRERESAREREREREREEKKRKEARGRDTRVHKFVPRSSLRRDLSDLLVGHDSIEHRKRRPLPLSLSLSLSLSLALSFSLSLSLSLCIRAAFASAFRGGLAQTAQTGIKYT